MSNVDAAVNQKIALGLRNHERFVKKKLSNVYSRIIQRKTDFERNFLGEPTFLSG